MGLDKVDFFRRKVIFLVQLLVDLRNGLVPVNVGMGGKILKGERISICQQNYVA